MFTFSKLGQYGRLGNQLFQIAATIGCAIDHNVKYGFNKWLYSNYFKNAIPQGLMVNIDTTIVENQFKHDTYTLDVGKNVDLAGFFQSEKFFINHKKQVLNYFSFKDGFIDGLKTKYNEVFKGTTCAIHVRRGDYVGNENYAMLTLDYYNEAIVIMGDVRFIVFSDDIKWCKEFLQGDFYFMESNKDIEDLALMSLCDNFIIANSSFSWWGAWLGEKPNSKIIAPAEWFSGALKLTHDESNIIPDRWVRYSPMKAKIKKEHVKIDLMDVTFTIPVKLDHPDRQENLDLCLKYLLHYFNTNIIITEHDTVAKIQKYSNDNIKHCFVPITDEFHRTRILNEMALESTTPIIANWDCDVFVDPEQLLEAVNKLRNKECAGIYPYDGRFLRAERKWLPLLEKELDVACFVGKPFKRYQFNDVSYGGAILWNKKDFIAGGMENENMIHYGPEDFERFERFTKLGFKIDRVKGALFHIDHHIDNNGSKGHKYLFKNDTELNKIRNMNRAGLSDYIKTWKWIL